MQLLTAAPRDTLTAAQVTRLLTGAPGIAYGHGLELLAADLTLIADISDDFEGGSVQRSMNADVHGTCSLKLARDVDYRSQLLRPYMTLSAEGVTARFNAGVYVPRKPQTTYGTNPRSNAVAGSDRLWQLKRPVGDSYVVLAGTGYLAACRQVIADAGLPASTLLLDGTAQAKALPADLLWPLTPTNTTTATVAPAAVPTAGAALATVQSGAATWLGIINDLLAAVNYRGLWCDENGFYRSEPYVDPAQRASEFAFDYDDPQLNVVESGRSVTRDLSSLPNYWVFLQQNLVDTLGNPLAPGPGVGEYVVDHSQVLSAPGYRGGIKWPSIVPLSVADQATLVAFGDAQVAADERVAKVLSVTCAPFPVAGHWDVYTYADDELGGSMRVVETDWTLDLGSGNSLPANMQRTWSVV